MIAATMRRGRRSISSPGRYERFVAFRRLRQARARRARQPLRRTPRRRRSSFARAARALAAALSVFTPAGGASAISKKTLAAALSRLVSRKRFCHRRFR